MDSGAKKAGLVGAIVIAIMIVIFGVIAANKNKTEEETVVPKGDSIEKLMKRISVAEATPTKGQISFGSVNLYDELPEIDKYPVAVSGNGQINIEIFTSGEKAGKGNDSFLIDVANEFNKSGVKTESGKTISMTVRSVASGTAADYIISGKYVPDLYTPSNTLFGDYAIVNNGDLELYESRLVGNTAGILVKKGTYSDYASIITAVQQGQIFMGYTNPQTSATGLNLLLTLLKDGNDNFTSFNKNIPYVAYTTQQMRDSANNGTLDAMLTEYQAYINDANLTSLYDFVPFGVRHDNPVYICEKSSKSEEELEAIKTIYDFCMSPEMQKIATNKGFNANDDYVSAGTFSGAEVTQGLQVYKKNKDNGKDIIAVFVADRSGSMDGVPMAQLKESLTNGANYINDNNYIGFVSYSSSVTIELPIAQFDLNQRAYFQGAINNLSAGGGTASYDALLVAIDMVTKYKAEREKNGAGDAKYMIFLLSDGYQNEGYDLDKITECVHDSGIPVYTIGYGDDADQEELKSVSDINEAASINADSEDILYKIKSLFNSQL